MTNSNQREYQESRVKLAAALHDPLTDAAELNRQVFGFLEDRARLVGFNIAQSSQLTRSLLAEVLDRTPGHGPLVTARRFAAVALDLPLPLARKAESHE